MQDCLDSLRFFLKNLTESYSFVKIMEAVCFAYGKSGGNLGMQGKYRKGMENMICRKSDG